MVMGALTLLHRWLGVALCLLFTMWFATGIVMLFVKYPALIEFDRINALAPVDFHMVAHSPGEAVAASTVKDATRVRLLQRSDGPVYVVSGTSGTDAIHAGDLSNAAVRSEQLALAIAVDHAHRRGTAVSQATLAGLADFDQWTVPDSFDVHRPLYRIALNDGQGTDLYVSSVTGEVVLETTRRERWWNYAGSVAHWIYPTVLRRHPALWSRLVWWLSLAALIGATAGAVLGTMRIRAQGTRVVSPYRGWQAWHHWLGLTCMLFVVTWIFSGWLSMDDGLLFTTGKPTDADVTTIAGTPAWQALPRDDTRRTAVSAKEIEWFVFGGHMYRRERMSADRQLLSLTDVPADVAALREFLQPEEVDAVARRLAPKCKAAVVVDSADAYRPAAAPAVPIYRSVCGDVWFQIDGASGALLEKLDSSRRVYRWAYGALHTFDIPAMAAHPLLRVVLIATSCGCGFAFSLTGVVIGWRRLRLHFGSVPQS
jgi:hypothetical protein